MTKTMTDQEMRETLRQMLADWDSATDEQREAALASAAAAAKAVEDQLHCWSFELWAPHQTAPGAPSYPIQLPDHTGRFFALTAGDARRRATEMAAIRGPGWSVGAGSHIRYSCCKSAR